MFRILKLLFQIRAIRPIKEERKYSLYLKSSYVKRSFSNIELF